MAAKAANDRSMGEAMYARLDAQILRNGVDPATMPEVPTYPENLTCPWEHEDPPCEKKEEDDEEDEEQGTRHQLSSPKLTDPSHYFEALGAMSYLKFGGVNHVGYLWFVFIQFTCSFSLFYFQFMFL